MNSIGGREQISLQVRKSLPVIPEEMPRLLFEKPLSGSPPYNTPSFWMQPLGRYDLESLTGRSMCLCLERGKGSLVGWSEHTSRSWTFLSVN